MTDHEKIEAVIQSSSADYIPSLEKQIKAVSMLQKQLSMSNIAYFKANSTEYASFHKKVLSKLSSITQRLLLAKQEGSEQSMEYSDIVEGVDDMLERVSESIDVIRGIKKEKNDEDIEMELRQMKKNEEAKQTSRIQRKKDQLPSTEDLFDIDNSYYPFIPKIKVKYNATSELNPDIEDARQRRMSNKEKLELKFEDAKDKSLKSGASLFPHPYQKEIKRFLKELNEHYLNLKKEMNKRRNKSNLIQFDTVEADMEIEDSPYHFLIRKYQPLNSTPLKYIQTKEELMKMLQELSDEKAIAVDLEHHNKESYLGLTCLIQISSRSTDYIVDACSLRYSLSELNQVFTNAKILKVFHGADYDIEWLQKDFGVYVVNMFDTGQASRMIKCDQFSLKYLLYKYCEIVADKKYQLADWRLRPLTQEMIKYAREDTHYLLFIYDSLMTQLVQDGLNKTPDDPFFFLVKVFEKSAELCLKEYTKPAVKSLAYYQFINMNSHRPPREVYLLKTIYKYRDFVARKLDYSPDHIMSKAQIGKLCRLKEFSYGSVIQEIDNCLLFKPFISEFVLVVVEAIGKFENKQREDDPKQREEEYCSKVRAMLAKGNKEEQKVKFNYARDTQRKETGDMFQAFEAVTKQLNAIEIKTKDNSKFLANDGECKAMKGNGHPNETISQIKEQFSNFNIVSYLKEKHNLNGITIKASTPSIEPRQPLLHVKHLQEEKEAIAPKPTKKQKREEQFSKFNDLTSNQLLYEKLKPKEEEVQSDSSDESNGEKSESNEVHPSLVNREKEVKGLMQQKPRDFGNKHRHKKCKK